MLKVDPIRVVQEPEYAASLTDAHWRTLGIDPAWNEMVGEHYEMAAPVLARYAAQLGMPETRQNVSSPRGPAKSEDFQLIGRRVPRLHGLGGATTIGQYTENIRLPGMLHTL